MDNAKLKQPYTRSTTDTSYTEEMLQALEKRKRDIPLKVFSRNIIDHRNKINYQSEYDKIRSHFHSNSSLPANTRGYLINRKAFLSSLRAKDIDRVI